jgi:sugar lactone lactonase YvrE
VDAAGNAYFTSGNTVLRLDGITGILTLIAGNGTYGFSGDNGAAANAQLAAPSGVAVDLAGNLYVADGNNLRVRKVSNGIITTIAGNGTGGYSGDNGPAVGAQLSFPSGVAVDTSGNLYIADNYSNCIRKVSNGLITTVAGTGIAGFSGDGGLATSAQLTGPTGVAVDAAGNLYIVDTGNGRIRLVSKGAIKTVAGGGTSFGDNGPATSAQLSFPYGVAVDLAGNLYIADPGSERVQSRQRCDLHSGGERHNGLQRRFWDRRKRRVVRSPRRRRGLCR